MSQTFTKLDDELIELRVPIRAVTAFGRLKFMANGKPECWVTHKKLALKLGVCDRQVRRILNELRGFKLITWKRDRYFCRYKILPIDRQWIAGLIAISDRTKMSGQIGHKCPISDRTKMSDRKESSSKKRTKEKNPLPPNPPSPTAEANAPRAKKTAEQPQTNAKATALPFQGFVDDDDADQPPELRFKARVLRRGHDRDPEMLIRNIRKQLEKADVTFAEFLEFDAVRSTGTTFTNPDGYYVALAKELALRKRRESLAAAYKPAAEEQAKQPDIERNEKGNCAKCGGSGQFKDGTFCGDCPTGRDLSRIAQRKRISRIAQRKSKPETSARRGAA